ncbi:MAG: rhomboid family intramembrane serine protease [Pseudomonadales bacterium]|jgi:GlpG protein|nr:rhomboid family intramembrane serine protease [Pseudomonadales bacterium]MDB3908102.1 rhomboid family intramembrane serine protease [Gammaproteobacteria bacterium]
MMIKAVSLPIEVNLLRFSQLLSSQGVAHRITEESGEQVIWVQDEPHARLLKEMLETWSFEQSSSANEASADAGQRLFNPLSVVLNLVRAFLRAPVSFILILACLLVALVSLLGTQPQRVAFLFYPVLDNTGLFALLGSIESPWELLRSLTPMLLHFGELHLVFNLMWLWYFGRQLEVIQPRWLTITLILFCSVAGNTTQYLYTGFNNFGGMSGVVYGLVGYTWIIHRFMPRSQLRINNSMFVVFVIALITMELVASAFIATAAHVGGLLAGLLSGVGAVVLYRLLLGRESIGR